MLLVVQHLRADDVLDAARHRGALVHQRRALPVREHQHLPRAAFQGSKGCKAVQTMQWLQQVAAVRTAVQQVRASRQSFDEVADPHLPAPRQHAARVEPAARARRRGAVKGGVPAGESVVEVHHKGEARPAVAAVRVKAVGAGDGVQPAARPRAWAGRRSTNQ